MGCKPCQKRLQAALLDCCQGCINATLKAVMHGDPDGAPFCPACRSMMERVEKTLCKGCQSELASLNADRDRRQRGVDDVRAEVMLKGTDS